MNLIEVRSFAAACMIVAAGFDPRRVEVLDNGKPVFYFDDVAGGAAQRFQAVKSFLRHLEQRAAAAREQAR
jgi:hypothetical protein